MMTENQKAIVGTLIIFGIAAIIVSAMLFFLAGANTKDAEHISKESQTIKECVDRQNTLEWCLNMFNK